MEGTRVTDLERIAAGREAEIFAWGDGKVLRLFREDRSREAVEREAAALAAVRAALPNVPAPGDCVEVDGRIGLVMERIDGPNLFDVIAQQPYRVRAIGAETGRLHAAINGIAAPPSLITTRERMHASIARSDAVPERLRAYLLDIVASLPEGDRLCHGDFHPGNVLRSDRGPTVIDWVNATRGDPAGDFARTSLMLDVGAPPPDAPALIRIGASFARRLMSHAYRRAYLAQRPLDPALVARWRIAHAGLRLTERIAEERPKLLAMLERATARQPQP